MPIIETRKHRDAVRAGDRIMAERLPAIPPETGSAAGAVTDSRIGHRGGDDPAGHPGEPVALRGAVRGARQRASGGRARGRARTNLAVETRAPVSFDAVGGDLARPGQQA